MKKTFEVVWAESAENDLCRIIAYIARDHPGHATNIFHKIPRKTSRLYHFPTRGIIPELHDQGVMLYREVVIHHGGSCIAYPANRFSLWLSLIRGEILKILSLNGFWIWNKKW
jgi:plasmid stabilization system protein ParE